MTDPRNEGSPSPRGGSRGRFWIGVAVFLGVALAHPFYAYQVQKRLAARDAAAAFAPAREPTSTVASELTAAEQRQAFIAAQQAAQSTPVPAPKGAVVYGSTVVGKQKVVIADLGKSSLAEATPSLCQQAAALERVSVAGERVRVQRYRGAEPAEDIGEIVCE